MGYIKVPSYAKSAARKALEERRNLPSSRKFGIDRSEASRLGIASGVERARQLIREDKISEETAKRIGRFYDRFKNKDGERAEGSIRLWGGRRFGRELSRRF